MGVASFVLGIISFVCCYFPIINLVFLITSFLSFVFGIVAIIGNKKAVDAGQQTKSNTFPIIGISLSIVSVVIIILINVFIFKIFENFSFDNIEDIVSRIEDYSDDIDISLNDKKIVIGSNKNSNNTVTPTNIETLPTTDASSKIYKLGETFENSILTFSIIDFNTSYSVNNSSSISTNKKVVQITIKVQNNSDNAVEFNSSSIHVTDNDSVTCQRYYSNSDKTSEYLTDIIEPHSTKVISLKYSISKSSDQLFVKYDMYPLSYDVISFVLDNK